MESVAFPDVTIITSVLNAQSTIDRCIKSVLSQSRDVKLEYIVIDGGSTDGTLDIVKSYSDQISYWVSEPDSGIYDAWNKGLARSSGKYIAFLGADDYYLENALSRYLTVLSGSPESDYVSSKVLYVGRVTRTIGKPYRWKDFRHHMNVAHVGSLHSRRLFTLYGCYDDSLRIAADYEFLLRAGNASNFLFLDDVTAVMGGYGVSSTHSFAAINETLVVKLRHKTCSKARSYFDYYLALLKVQVKSMLLALSRFQ